NMASNAPQQAGGGSSECLRTVDSLNETMRTHLKAIFACRASSTCSSDQRWSGLQISGFATETQREAALPTALAEAVATEAESGGMDFAGFLQYITSSASAATAPPRSEDLSWPLAAYFVSSSHNTYLTGNQLSSSSSASAYKNVLLRGCKCIEV